MKPSSETGSLFYSLLQLTCQNDRPPVALIIYSDVYLSFDLFYGWLDAGSDI